MERRRIAPGARPRPRPRGRSAAAAANAATANAAAAAPITTATATATSSSRAARGTARRARRRRRRGIPGRVVVVVVGGPAAAAAGDGPPDLVQRQLLETAGCREKGRRVMPPVVDVRGRGRGRGRGAGPRHGLLAGLGRRERVENVPLGLRRSRHARQRSPARRLLALHGIKASSGNCTSSSQCVRRASNDDNQHQRQARLRGGLGHGHGPRSTRLDSTRGTSFCLLVLARPWLPGSARWRRDATDPASPRDKGPSGPATAPPRWRWRWRGTLRRVSRRGLAWS